MSQDDNGYVSKNQTKETQFSGSNRFESTVFNFLLEIHDVCWHIKVSKNFWSKEAHLFLHIQKY